MRDIISWLVLVPCRMIAHTNVRYKDNINVGEKIEVWKLFYINVLLAYERPFHYKAATS